MARQGTGAWPDRGQGHGKTEDRDKARQRTGAASGCLLFADPYVKIKLQDRNRNIVRQGTGPRVMWTGTLPHRGQGQIVDVYYLQTRT